MTQKSDQKMDSSRKVVEHGPSVGRHLNLDIPAWIVTGDGKRHEYSRILKVDEFSKLEAMESVIHPGLVYRTSL